MLYLIGIIFIALGILFKFLPPQKINSIYGYRTKLSMKNQDTWNEAQRYSAYSFLIFGLIYLIAGLVFHLFLQNIDMIYQILVFLTGIFIMIIFDEGHLRKMYNKDGSKIDIK